MVIDIVEVHLFFGSWYVIWNVSLYSRICELVAPVIQIANGRKHWVLIKLPWLWSITAVIEVLKLLKEPSWRGSQVSRSECESAEQGSCLCECLGEICNCSVSLGMFSGPATIHSLTVQYPVLSIKKIMNYPVCVLDMWMIQHGFHLEMQ